MHARDVDGIGAPRPGSPPLVSCAATRDQLHRQEAMGRATCTMDGVPGVTAINEDPVRGMSGKSLVIPPGHGYGGGGWPTWR